MSAARRLSLGLLAMSPAAVGSDVDSDPIWVENLAPVAGLVALTPMRSAEVSEGWKFDTHLAIASHWARQTTDDETVFFDGETRRFSVAAEYGFASDWSARFTLPWVSNGAGFLDDAINGWHDIFGLSDGNKSNFPDDQFGFVYAGPTAGFDVTNGNSGLGDVRAELSHTFHQNQGRAASVAVGYKFASGDEQEWLGSGSGDFFTTVRFSGRHLADLPLSWHGQLGYVYAGDIDVLSSIQKRHLWIAGLSLDWRVSDQWSLLAQYDGHGALADSELDALGGGGGSAMLSFAARWRFSDNAHLDLSFVEDIAVESAPDITFQASLRWRPGH